jgi:GT2 family glycosyltransferase
MPAVKDLAYASGAGFIISTELLKKYGSWDNDFFLYHEDLEFSLRLRINKYRVVCVRDSILYHKYEFSRSITKYYWMERNRFGVLLMFYKWPTLLLISPILFALELGLIVFALKGGWFMERMKVYQYWIQPSSWKLWLGKRAKTQAMRQIDDKAILKTCVSEVLFQETTMQNPLLTYVGNPIMKLYYNLIMMIIVW